MIDFVNWRDPPAQFSSRRHEDNSKITKEKEKECFPQPRPAVTELGGERHQSFCFPLCPCLFFRAFVVRNCAGAP